MEIKAGILKVQPVWQPWMQWISECSHKCVSKDHQLKIKVRRQQKKNKKKTNAGPHWWIGKLEYCVCWSKNCSSFTQQTNLYAHSKDCLQPLGMHRCSMQLCRPPHTSWTAHLCTDPMHGPGHRLSAFWFVHRASTDVYSGCAWRSMQLATSHWFQKGVYTPLHWMPEQLKMVLCTDCYTRVNEALNICLTLRLPARGFQIEAVPIQKAVGRARCCKLLIDQLQAWEPAVTGAGLSPLPCDRAGLITVT